MRYVLLLAAMWTGGWAADVRLDVEVRWGGEKVVVPTGQVTTAEGQLVRVTRVAALVSGVVMHRADGGSVRLEGQYGALDAESGRLSVPLREVPAGEYVGFEFLVGVPPAVNHGDIAPWPAGHALNPMVNGLHWSWQNGYVFLALEGRWWDEDAAAGGRRSEERGFLYHLGSDARLMAVRLAAHFRVEGSTVVRLALDVARVLRGRRLVAGGASESTHSAAGDELAGQLAAATERAWFWLGAEEVAPTSGGKPDAAGVNLAKRHDLGTTPVAFVVPPGFPQPELPVDNPLTVEGVALGRALFHDSRLSGNGTQSCASCHAPERAFSDTRARSIGAEGVMGTRNAMPLFNLAWSSAYAWDGGQVRVRDQSLAAMINPIEMNGDVATVVATLARDASTRAAFAKAFGTEKVTADRVGRALEQYLLTIVDADSRFDRALRGETGLSDEERRGFELFLTEYDPARGKRGADCFHCHGGPLFTDFGFKHNGLAETGADLGREGATRKASDRRKFKTPSLRNVALTGPYMHDGRFATLEEVVAHYDHGVTRGPTLDPNLAKHPAEGLGLTAEEQRALVAFLRTLTDGRYGR